ncbi:NUDIX hydrolase [Streptomyces sp. NPDC050610]|uniref:NUDIX hydrolase n=1 Tax=Streptomyces sp. NPDC050610 TaxID=3157097 RepID=UPI0034442F49
MNASPASTDSSVPPVCVDPDLYWIVARGLLVNEAGAVLLVRQRLRAAGDDRWCRLPGGRVEDELPADAVARHVRTQTGLPLDPRAARLRAVDWTPAAGSTAAGATFIYAFTAAIPAAFTVVLADSLDHAVWASATDLDRLCAPSHASQVKAALAAVRDNTCINLRADGPIAP